MNIVELAFQVDEQKLKLLTLGEDGKPLKFASDTVGYIWARFSLGENWTGFDSVRAMWKFGSHPYKSVLDSEGLVKIPHEVFHGCPGEVQVNLVGSTIEGDEVIERLTSYPVLACWINKIALVDASETVPLTPSQIEQFAHNVKEDADRAEAAKEDARDYRDEAEDFKDDTAQLKTDVEGLKEDVIGLKTDVEGLKQDVIDLKDKTLGYKNDTADLKQDVIDLKDDVIVLKNTTEDYKDTTKGYMDTSKGYMDTTKGYMNHTDEVASEIHNLTAEAEDLPPGSQPTASYDPQNGKLSLGIPRGDKGDKGDKGNVNYAVCDLDPITGHLFMVYDDEYTGPEFELRDDGHLEVII